MDRFRSTRFSSRARTSERGFALAIALILAVLYFGLIELLLIDSSRELAQARLFRSRVVAQTLADNAAEGAARMIHNNPPGVFNEEDDQGTMRGLLKMTGQSFVLTGEAESAGVDRTRARVDIIGDIDAGKIRIVFAQYSQ